MTNEFYDFVTGMVSYFFHLYYKGTKNITEKDVLNYINNNNYSISVNNEQIKEIIKYINNEFNDLAEKEGFLIFLFFLFFFTSVILFFMGYIVLAFSIGATNPLICLFLDKQVTSRKFSEIKINIMNIVSEDMYVIKN